MYKDKRYIVILGIIILISLISVDTYASSIDIFIDDVKLETKVINEGGHTLVAARDVFEALGLRIEWNPKNKTVIGRKDDRIISMVIGSRNGRVNNKKVKMDIPAKIIKGKTYVPIRFVGEAIGLNVDWNHKTKAINIKSKGGKRLVFKNDFGVVYEKDIGEKLPKGLVDLKFTINREPGIIRILLTNGGEVNESFLKKSNSLSITPRIKGKHAGYNNFIRKNKATGSQEEVNNIKRGSKSFKKDKLMFNNEVIGEFYYYGDEYDIHTNKLLGEPGNNEEINFEVEFSNSSFKKTYDVKVKYLGFPEVR